MSEKPQKMNLNSEDITAQKREQLRQIFPEVFSEDKVDFDHLKRLLREDAGGGGAERFGLNWHGKKKSMEIIQQPSIATLKPARNESVNFDNTENLFIEGDNLEVLKLLQKSYFGKVKMIYIDPPYNTGKEFIYPDNFTETLDTYLRYTGQTDSEGRKFSTNTDTSGRYHSNWLNMMYPRLYLARNLLRDDGVIFISISDQENSNLRKICDEIFGEDNFLSMIVWNSTKSVTNTALISEGHTYNLVYAKDKTYFRDNRHLFRLPETGDGFSNPDNDLRGVWKADPFQVGGWRPNQQYEITNPATGKKYLPNPGSSWKNDKTKFQRLLDDNRIVFGVSGESGPSRKRFLFEAKERGKVAKTWWDDVGTTSNGTTALRNLCNGYSVFSNPKPVELIEKMIQLGDSTKEGVILDFFAGSATTAHAVYNLNNAGGNHKFILVQLPESIDVTNKDNESAIKFCSKNKLSLNISEIAKERCRRVATKTNANNGFKVFKLARSNFKVWESNVDKIEDLQKQLVSHVDHIDPESSTEDILYELLLKSGFPLTIKIEKRTMASATVFAVDEGKFLICLEKNLTQEIIDAIAEARPQQVICLDDGFKNNDELKVNAVQTFKSLARREEREVVFQTV